MRKSAQERLLNLLLELYGRSQQPILTKDLFKGVENLTINQDFGVGKDYPLETYLEAEILAVHKEWSKGKKEVIWNTDVPDAEMVLRLWKCRKKVDTKPTNDLVENNEEVEVVLTTIDKIIGRFDVEYKNFAPNKTTIPDVIQMLRVMEHNARDRYCHKDKLCCTTTTNEDNEIIDVDHRAGKQYSNKKCCQFDVLEQNPKIKSEYKYIAQYDDINVFARQLAFAVNYAMNPNYYEGLRSDRLVVKQKVEVQVVHEEPEVVEADNLQGVVNDLQTELRITREENQKISANNKTILGVQEELVADLQENLESNKEIKAELSEKLLFVREATLKLVEALKTVNNLISENQQ